ncbi:MAG: choice-of-anchor Q domain-containing protein [Solirubrobacterales bacterium]
MLASAGSASADVFVVNSLADAPADGCSSVPGGCTLRDAITETNDNLSVEGDQIDFDVTGAIGLSTPLPEIETRTTITGPGPGPGALTVYRQSGLLRIFTLNGTGAGDAIRIERLTIDNGDAGTLSGGGVFVDAGGVNILDQVVVKDNKAANGGGIFISSDTGASLDIVRSMIIGNTANGAPQGTGGGIRNQGELLVDSSTIANNSATTGSGGGISSGETSGDSAVIVNSTIAGNKASSFGGGLQLSNGGLSLLSDTIARNTSNSDDSGSEPGGGVSLTATGADFANTILAENVRGTAAPVADQCVLGSGVGTTLDSDGYNLRSSDDPNPGVCGPHFNKPGDSVNPVPLLGLLADNGGATETIALLPGSPAINAGNPLPPASMAYPACRPSDQRGLPRGGVTGICDIGAFEVQPAPATGAGTPSPPSPPNQFEIARVKRNKKKGTANLFVVVPGPGEIGLEGKGIAEIAAEGFAAKSVAVAGGEVKLKVKPAKKGKQGRRLRNRLRRKGNAKVTVQITFQPSGGSPSTQGAKLTLIDR